MGDEIKITNAKVFNLYQDALKHEDNDEKTFTKNEQNWFEQEAEKQGLSNDVDYKKIIGFYATKPINNNSAVEEPESEEIAPKPTQRAAVDPKKQQRKYFENSVEELAESARTPEQLMTALNNRFKLNGVVAPEYVNLLKEAEKIAAAVKTSNYNSKEDIENLHKNLKGQISDIKGAKDILKAFEKVAEKDQQNKEFMNLKPKFDFYVSGAKAETGANYKAYLDKIEGELKKSGEWKKSYTKEAFKKLEAYAKKQSEVVRDSAAIANARGEEFTQAIDTSFKATKNNKHHEKLVNLKLDGDKRIEEMKSLSRDDIEKGLGKKLTAKLLPYMESYRNENGTYDLSRLITDAKEGVRHHVGADNTMNRDYDDEQLDERHWVTYGIEALTNGNIKAKEAEKIADFANIKVQKRSHKIKDAVEENLPMLATGALVGATFGVYADQTVDIKCSQEMASDLISQIGDKANLVSSNGQNAHVKVHQLADLKLLSAVGGALEGLAAGILMSVIFGVKKNEKTCFNVDKASNYRTIEELKKFVEKEYPDKAEAVVTFAQFEEFKNEDGTWNPERFYEFLRNYVEGRGSRMNSDECFMAFAQKLPKKQPRPVVGVKLEEEKKPEQCRVEVVADIKLDGKEGRPNSINYGWHEIIMMYYSDCLQNHTEKEIRFALKKYNHIPLDFKYVPTGVNLPSDLFKDGSCQRTDKKDVKKGHYTQLKTKSKITLSNGVATATDGCDGRTATGRTKAEALQNLKNQTGKTYSNEAEIK